MKNLNDLLERINLVLEDWSIEIPIGMNDEEKKDFKHKFRNKLQGILGFAGLANQFELLDEDIKNNYYKFYNYIYSSKIWNRNIYPIDMHRTQSFVDNIIEYCKKEIH
jgi:hypothetical protein